MLEGIPHTLLWPSLVWHTYVSDTPCWLDACFNGWNKRLDFCKWNTLMLPWLFFFFAQCSLNQGPTWGHKHWHVMQVAIVDDKYYYVWTDWGHVVLEERNNICPSRGKALSYIWCKELGVPPFFCTWEVYCITSLSSD
jgi:hypothetical protein